MSAHIDLSNINVDLTLEKLAELGIPQIAQVLGTGIKADVGLGNIGLNVGGSVGLGLDNIKVDATADVGLNNIHIKELPVVHTDSKLESNSKIDAGLDNIRITELPPFHFEFSMKPIRIHLPLNYSFCLELFGVRLFKFSVCGEGMVVTEDYVPHTTERCG